MCYDIFSKYTYVVSLKNKNGVSIVNGFQKILKESIPKPNKIVNNFAIVVNNFTIVILKNV